MQKTAADVFSSLSATTAQINALMLRGDVAQALALAAHAEAMPPMVADASPVERCEFHVHAGYAACQLDPLHAQRHVMLAGAELTHPDLTETQRGDIFVQWLGLRNQVALWSEPVEAHAQAVLDSCNSFMRSPVVWSPSSRALLVQHVVKLLGRCGGAWLLPSLTETWLDMMARRGLSQTQMAHLQCWHLSYEGNALLAAWPASDEALPRLSSTAPSIGKADLERRSQRYLDALQRASLDLGLRNHGAEGISVATLWVPRWTARMERQLGGSQQKLLDAETARLRGAALLGSSTESYHAELNLAEAHLMAGNLDWKPPGLHGDQSESRRFIGELQRTHLLARWHLARGEHGRARAWYATYAMASARGNRVIERMMNFGVLGLVRMLSAAPAVARPRSASRQRADMSIVAQALQTAALAKGGSARVADAARSQGLSPRRLQQAFKDAGMARPSRRMAGGGS